MELEKLRRALRIAWTAETSYDPERWSPENPAWGQCAVTCTIVQDFFGGEIRLTEALLPSGEAISHFYNILDPGTGRRVDLTCEQFPLGTEVPEGEFGVTGFGSIRDYILACPSTVRRYEILRHAVDAEMAKTEEALVTTTSECQMRQSHRRKVRPPQPQR
jgi:hypothetical protein